MVIGGLAVGAAIGTGLRHLFGEARAVRAEEAGVQVMLMLRQVREDTEAQLGRELTTAERKKMFSAAEQQLAALGFKKTATGWSRPRSAVERFFG